MKLVKITINSDDRKHRFQHTSVHIANSEKSAMNYLTNRFGELTDLTEKFKEEHHWLEEDELPIKVLEFIKNRVDEDGDYDYPCEYDIHLEWEEVIE